MRFGEILSRSWRQMWTGGSWGFLATWYLSAFVLTIVLVVVSVLVVGGLSAVSGLDTSSPDSLLSGLGAGIFALVGLALLLFIPLGLVMQGGIVHLSNERALDRPVRVGAGWSAGFRNIGPLFVIGLTMFLVAVACILILALPFGLIFGLGALSMSGVENGEIGSIFGACCCGGLFYLVWIAIAIMLQSWSEVSVRHVVIDGLKGGESLSKSFGEIRSQFKMTLLFALMLFGITVAITLPFSLMSSPFDQLAQSEEAGVALAGSLVSFGISLVSMFVSAALSLFQASAWTHYFRTRFGHTSGAPASVSATPPAYIPPPAPYGAPAPPAAETSAPMAPPVVLADAPIVDVVPAEEPQVYVEAPEPMQPPAASAGFMTTEAPAEEPAEVPDAPPAEEAPPADV